MPPSADIQDLSSHARTRLAPSKKKGLTRQEKLALYKRFLKTEEHRIYLLHKSGAAGLRVAGRRSDLIDVIVRNLYEDGLEDAEREGDTSKAPPLAILAAGGYGRGRLNPHSDIDLHFITPKGGAKLPAAQKKLVESVLYMLYDCGFKVGHAVRSVRETIQQANQDTKTKSAIIEARLICGNEELFDTLLEEFQKKCIARHEKEYLTTRLEDLRSRHAKWANTVFLQEPNVKESCGGLRDYQNLIWVAFVKTGSTRLADLHERKMMTVSAYRELRKGYDFLMRVRNELHYIQKRSGDILTLRLQGIVARNFQYPQRGVLRKTEAFMRDYYEHTRNVLLRSSELLDEFYLEQTAEAGGLSGLLGKANKPDHSIDGFVVKQDRLYADPKLRFADDPNQILQLFRHAQLRKLRLAPELVQKIQRHYKQINRTFRYSKTNRETFEAILSRKGEVAPALRKMHRAGVLGRYMPEFGALTNLVQHEFFHRYTADEHTLRCIEELDGLATDESPKAGVFRKQFLKLEDPFVIYLSLLLHDTGRAFNTDAHDQASAELAGKVCRRLGLDIRRRRLVLFLVDHHLTFWRTATTKNLEDPVTISEFASIIRDRTRLDYLFLHTYADSRGTNDEAWTDWKASLIRQLYFTTVEYIEDHESFLKKYETDKAVLFEQVEAELPAVFDAAIREHFECSPKRYFRTQSPEKICAHIKLIEEHKKTDAVIPTFNWKPQPEMGWTTLST
ncbi:MAG: HD domain-containing protein, partial [Verrucomicrobiota bacterium]